MFMEIAENLEKPFPVLLTAYGAAQEQSIMVRPDGFPFHHIFWVTDGEGRFEFDGEVVHIPAGYGVFIRKDFPHTYQRAGDKFSTAWCTFRGAEDMLNHYGMGNYKIFKLPAYFKEFCRPLELLSEKGSTVGERSAACYSWLVELLEVLAQENVSSMQVVREYIENNFATPITLDELAERTGQDRFAVCRNFKKEYGISVMNYLKQIRIAKAKHFLKYTAFTVAEIGVMCGFESPSYFGKIFREETGVTPKAYRSAKR